VLSTSALGPVPLTIHESPSPFREVSAGPVSALIPDDYLPDVHPRLVFYKRIAGAGSPTELDELQVEMIDRFGLLPEPAKALFGVTELKLRVQPLGVRKLEAGPQGGRILFNGQPNIDPMRVIKLIQTRPKEFKMDGGDKIRFFRDMEERGKRIEVVREVVEMLACLVITTMNCRRRLQCFPSRF